MTPSASRSRFRGGAQRWWVACGLTMAAAFRLTAAEPPAEVATQSEMTAVFDGYFKTGLDVAKPLAVRGLKLKRDNMELTLGDGVVYLALPLAGRVPGAYFRGNGTIRVTIPNPMDRKLFRSVYPKPTFDEPIGEAVLRFNDGTESEILAVATPDEPGGIDPTGIWSDRQKIDYNATSLQMDFLENQINMFPSAAFFAISVRIKDGRDWFGFSQSGRRRIEDALYKERSMGSAGKRWYEVLSMFHRPEDYDTKGTYDLLEAADLKEPAALRHVEMDIDIPDTRSILIDARVTVEALRDGLKAVRFDLLNNLGDAWYESGRTVTVTGVSDSSDRPLPYIHGCNDLLVLLPRPLTRGEKTVIRVKATENTIIQLSLKSYWIFTDSAWFPKIGQWGGRYTFDWTIRVRKPMRAASSGDLVKEWVEGDRNCGRYKSEVPASLASFIFGELKTTDGKYTRTGPGQDSVGLRMYTVYGSQVKTENILFNISQGLKSYEAAFGPYTFKELDIAEMAPQVGFAQSPAGILLLPEGFAGESGGGGSTDQVVFHELAHQWWGGNVGIVSPEDDWISESWAEYSAGLITEAINPKKFDTMRDEWRKKALETDRYGTIATAYRSSSVDYPSARTNLLYSKGPCVIHMLRTWMGWEKFSKYVATVQSKYAGMDINTDTMAREASATMGYDMFPFFDQWIRDKGIPKVHYSWTVAPEADGKQLLTITVRQEDEANFKLLMVPIALDFGKGEPTIVQKPILKSRTEIQFRVPILPKRVTLDADQDQLAIFIPDTPGR